MNWQDEIKQLAAAIQPGQADYAKVLSQPKRASSYRQQYLRQLSKILALNYPKLAAYLGSHSFQGLCHSYIEMRPCQDYQLDQYGEGLAEFLEGTGGIRRHPYLPDLARLERGLLECGNSEEEISALSQEQIAQKVSLGEADEIEFYLPVSLNIQSSHWQLWSLWRELKPPTHGGLHYIGYWRGSNVKVLALSPANGLILTRMKYHQSSLQSELSTLHDEGLLTSVQDFLFTGINEGWLHAKSR